MVAASDGEAGAAITGIADATPVQPHIGELNESPLHAGLKSHFAESDDRFEVKVGRHVVDILRGDDVVEIQTGSFGAMRRKLDVLLKTRRVEVVYPIATQKWIIKIGDDGTVSRRRSPKRLQFHNMFGELVSMPQRLDSPGFRLRLAATEIEEVWVPSGDRRRGWRRGGWVVDHRRLVAVLDTRLVASSSDLLDFLPADLPMPFDTAVLAAQVPCARRLAQQMVYCLRETGQVAIVGKRGNALLYDVASAVPAEYE